MIRGAVIFGAGKVACGLLGEITHTANLHTTFIARKPSIVNAINTHEGYFLRIVDKKIKYSSIRDCHALLLNEFDKVAQAVSQAEVVFTGVGISNLTSIAPFIAAGLERRHKMQIDTPLNIIVCENIPGSAEHLRKQVISSAKFSDTQILKNTAYSTALANRIMGRSDIEHGELCHTVDKNWELTIDRSFLLKQLPKFEGLNYTSQYNAMYMQKLYSLNCAKAVAAYLGYHHDCFFLHEAATHPEVEPVLNAAMQEAQSALLARFPNHITHIIKSVKYALVRIKDTNLQDTVERVAENPKRKLAAQERLMGPIRLAHQFHLPYGHLAKAVAAAIAYDNETDQEALVLQKTIKKYGMDKVLTDQCGILPYDHLGQKIRHEYKRIYKEKMKGPRFQNVDRSHNHASTRSLFSF